MKTKITSEGNEFEVELKPETKLEEQILSCLNDKDINATVDIINFTYEDRLYLRGKWEKK